MPVLAATLRLGGEGGAVVAVGVAVGGTGVGVSVGVPGVGVAVGGVPVTVGVAVTLLVPVNVKLTQSLHVTVPWGDH